MKFYHAKHRAKFYRANVTLQGYIFYLVLDLPSPKSSGATADRGTWFPILCLITTYEAWGLSPSLKQLTLNRSLLFRFGFPPTGCRQA